MTPVFLTIDTEFMWRHHAAGLDLEGIHTRSIEPGGVGLAWQLATLARHGLKATFFVDPMPALIYGIAPFAEIVQAILAARQEVQLHLHPNWVGADMTDRKRHGRFELVDLSRPEQQALIEQAIGLLVAAGAPCPVAFRAGSYSANDDTLAALAALGITYDSSHNGAHHPWPSAIDLDPRRIAPIAHGGVIEVPVTLIEDRRGHLRNVQICALSRRELGAVLDDAVAEEHAALTIVGHSFEIATRRGTAANAVHRARFVSLCGDLASRRARLPTTHFANRPTLRLDADDRPLPPSLPRLAGRLMAQAWSNQIAERA